MTEQHPGKIRLRSSERRTTAQFACAMDQRFSYCMYVPESYDEDAHDLWPLVVVVHGTLRTAQSFRDKFAEFAEAHRVIVLAPLFPAGIDDPSDENNYKFIEYHGIRFDRILLSMIGQVAQRFRVQTQRFLMFGFSGGGQFVHRFLYLHPDRLLAVSIGAPGLITVLDSARPWWVGTQGFKAMFGVEPDIEAMKAVRVHMIIGDADISTDIQVEPTSSLYMPGANESGTTRIERLRTLAASFERAGIPVRFELAPGVKHEALRPELIGPVQSFFGEILRDLRGAP